MDLELLDGKRVTVVLRGRDQVRRLRGTGAYRRHCCQPRELAVLLDEEDASTEFAMTIVLREEDWVGEIFEEGHPEQGHAYRIEVNLDN